MLKCPLCGFVAPPDTPIWMDDSPVHAECLDPRQRTLPPELIATIASSMVWVPRMGAVIAMGHLWWGDFTDRF